jgi:hypothetical protein
VQQICRFLNYGSVVVATGISPFSERDFRTTAGSHIYR